jgi:uncharacterized protein involved in exopolysaccharide biosynthesis
MYEQDEISLKDLASEFWRAKWVVIAVTLGGACLAGGVAAVLPEKYEATAVVSPVSSNSPGARLANQASSLGGLASLIGVSVGSDSNRSESIAVLQSEALTERYITENNLLPVLFASKWDAAQKRWKNSDASKHPTPWKGSRVFAVIRKVVDDKRTGLVTITVTWTDAVAAAKWANGLVKMANDELRNKAIAESEQHIAYLTAEAQKTDVAQVRAAIYTVLESEIKNVMLAKGPGDYALKVLDPAIAPELKASPRISLWALAGFSVGLILSGAWIFVRSAGRAGREVAPA